MTQIINSSRIILGAACIVAGFALVLLALAFQGALMRIGIADGFRQIVFYISVAGAALPLFILGAHTLFWRAQQDAMLNYKAMRAVELIVVGVLGTHSYAYFAMGFSVGLVPAVAVLMVAGLCWQILRAAPGGIAQV